MSYDHHFVRLDNLIKKRIFRLQIRLLTCLQESLAHRRVIGCHQRDARKQIRDDALEQWHIEGQKLGQIDVDQRAQQQNVFVFFGKRLFDIATS